MPISKHVNGPASVAATAAAQGAPSEGLGHLPSFPTGCIDELFERCAAEVPKAVAVSYEASSLSYDELNTRANRLARRLRQLGVSPDALVALAFERSLDMVVAILAVLKAGGAYVPLDPDYPAERLAFVMNDCGAQVLLTQEAMLERLPAPDATVLCLDRDAAQFEGLSGENLERVAAPENLAYVIYTSGSTGQPKGVLVEHRNVTRLFSATDAWYGFGPTDTWTLFHSYAFDFSVWEIWGALLYGGRLVVVPQWITRTPQALAQLISEEAVTVFNATPSLFIAAMGDLLDRGHELSLRLVIFGGEALTPRLLRPWFDRFGDRRPQLVNMYGITETTVHVTYRPLVAQDAERDASPIGEPIPDLALHVLDEHLEPVAEDVAGELYVGGAGVARGYLNRPELNAERFLEDPLGSGRLYRTGDRARWQREHGVLYEGRVDDQVKVRGFRIELGEIEAALLEHRDVTRAAVAVQGVGVDAELAAYVIPVHGRPVSAHEVRAFLAESLPAHMVPSTVTALKTFPLTANGKLDRKALPEPSRERSSARELVEPRTPLEQRLAEIWERELDIKPIGVQDNFFDLGVRSILAGQLFAAIERELGNRLPLGAIFRAPTIESLALLLDADQQDVRLTSLVPIQPEGAGAPIFCVHGAAGTIFHLEPLARRLGTGQPFYGLQARGLYGEVPPLTTVPEMATHYISEIREVQPHGPYRLAGAFFGSTVAFEMAEQLVADGETVELLASFNGPSPIWTRQYGWFGNQPGYQARAARPVPLTRKQRLRRAIREPRRFGTALARNYQRLVGVRYRRNAAKVTVALDRPLPEKLREEFFCDVHIRAQGAYEPPPYEGQMLTFYGEGLYDDPELGWTPLVTGGVQSYCVPGVNRNNMHAIVEPNVAFLAERLREHLSQLEAERPPVGLAN